LNPYIHRYHPDHGHPEVMTQGGVPATGGIEVKRTLFLDFEPTDPRAEEEVELDGEMVRNPPRPEYGDTLLGGTYREVIETMTYHPVIVQGSFELRKVVQEVGVLNAGMAVE
jgi:hypothetical protein